MVRLMVLALSLAVLAGCGGTREAAVPTLTVRFIDAAWNGEVIPRVGMCRRCGGEGRSPALLVSDIPAGAEALIVEFDDLSFEPLARFGGHGTLRVDCRGAAEARVPSVVEGTLAMPDGVSVERSHRAPVATPDGYLGPCACDGSRNLYQATVRAVVLDPSPKREHRVLSVARLRLGLTAG